MNESFRVRVRTVRAILYFIQHKIDFAHQFLYGHNWIMFIPLISYPISDKYFRISYISLQEEWESPSRSITRRSSLYGI